MYDVTKSCVVSASHFRVLVAADENGHVGMVEDAVADTAKESAAEFPLSSAANHYKPRPNLLCIFNDLVPGIVTMRVRELCILDLATTTKRRQK